MLRLAQWSSRSPGMRYDARLGIDSLVLSLRALFDAPSSAGFEATVVLVLGEQRFRLAIADQQLAVSRGGGDRPDVVIETDPATLLTLLRTHHPPADAMAAGTLRLAGDPAVAERFRGLFPEPEPLPIADRT